MGKRTLKDLAGLSTAELDQIFAAGKTPDFEKLNGWEFKGYNVPFFAKLLGIKKFKKGFYVRDGEPRGFNIPIYQNSIDEPWRCRPVDHNPKRFGFYTVKVAKAGDVEGKEPGALILNYSDGHNLPWEGSFLRDYLKQVDPENDDLFLGKAYTALGSARMMPSFFILERDRKAPTEVDKK